jgi:hypothetical protein
VDAARVHVVGEGGARGSAGARTSMPRVARLYPGPLLGISIPAEKFQDKIFSFTNVYPKQKINYFLTIMVLNTWI